MVYTDSHATFWKAYIDGVEVPLEKAADAFKAVDVPAGQHEILFKYAPLGGQWVYILLSIVFLLMLLATVIARSVAQRSDACLPVGRKQS